MISEIWLCTLKSLALAILHSFKYVNKDCYDIKVRNLFRRILSIVGLRFAIKKICFFYDNIVVFNCTIKLLLLRDNGQSINFSKYK